ncbi:radial spoke head protein 4 homolog A isoform X1 [Anarrhichthys ocellatus]|uniref:radial spoke head protein 4 homolog A isoform X1 n=2 Tax=Anarrhichthys ocellatus TaxID=433405 RepID=UPI0012EDACE8|nr:radial spoke head protein 4 homolog A-like isoform X1 [Anarrhichthys ocellatus]
MDAERDDSEQSLQSAASFKALMMTSSTQSNMNLYDHLTQVLMKVMDEHPHNAVDVIEDISHDVKRTFFEEKQSTLRDLPQTTAAELLAEKQRLLFAGPEEDDQEEKPMESPLPNVSVIGFYWEQAGVGLGREEMLRVFLALKQLVESQKLLRCRLWGKILGTESSYIVAEAEYGEGEVERSSEESAEEEEREAEIEEDEEDPLPRSTYEPLPALPEETLGTGANKCVYYVCKEPGLPWVKLPSVSPAQITVARQIRKFFTGRLDNPVVSYPPFTGNEANYLRAQIARISAGTQVSPEGFYKPAEDEDDEEDEEALNSVEVNPDFEGISVAELAESLSTWVHHVQHILQQGRCTLADLAKKMGDDSNEEGEAEEKEDDDEPEQVGPPLLTRLSEDAEKFNIPPWTLRVSSTLTFQHALAVIRSNLWPGAYAYSCGKTFENIYVGWGLKYAGEGYSPPVPPPPQNEYPSGPEITEALDPSLEEELALQETLEEERDAEEELEDIDDEDDEEDDD